MICKKFFERVLFLFDRIFSSFISNNSNNIIGAGANLSLNRLPLVT